MIRTFPQQVLGLPPELVRQGWRLSPSDNITTAWSDGVSPLCRWQYVIRCGVMLARPLRVVAYSVSSDWPITAYAHEGWGGGTAPTPEMVKIWEWWWAYTEDGVIVPTSCRVDIHGGVVWRYPWMSRDSELTIEDCLLFRGPVLPPAGVP